MTDGSSEAPNRRNFLVGGTGAALLVGVGLRLLIRFGREWGDRPPAAEPQLSPSDILATLRGVFDKQVAAIKSGESDQLSLAYVTDPDEKLRSIAGLKGLKSIRLLANDNVTDAGIKTFATFPDLKTVNLDFVHVPASWPPLLANCAGLEVVKIAPKLPPRFDVAQFLDLPHLRVLVLTVDPHGDQAMDDESQAWLDRTLSGLSEAKQLEQLIFVGGPFADRMEQLAALQKGLAPCKVVLYASMSDTYKDAPTPLEADPAAQP